ncbi:MAG: ATP-dependent helicase, partial [Bryobacteraceae bacterium]
MAEIDGKGSLDRIGHQDHSASREYRIFGPPGTGKTTSLNEQISRAVARYGNNSVLVTSFSKATAAELMSRDMSIAADRIGTLHSVCFRALGKPAIAEAHVAGWNRDNPRMGITPVSSRNRLDGEDLIQEEEDGTSHDGDALLQQMNRCRGIMLERAAWPWATRNFASKWERYKSENRLLDFCDLIETASHDVPVAPNMPAVIVADEAQDLNRMQLTLIRRWSNRANYLVLAGDDDQTVYGWTGASPEAILGVDIPEDHKIFLTQSRRVPRAVHAVSERLIHQVNRRQEKTYLPRPAAGEVHRLTQADYRSPEYEILKTVERHLKQGKSIMFLASCSYMLLPLLAVLRKHGIPFHNPYRRSSGFWNPLRSGSRHSATRRILALLAVRPGPGKHHPLWDGVDLTLWWPWLRTKGVLKTDYAEALSLLLQGETVTLASLEGVFEPGAFVSLRVALENGPLALLEWWRIRLAEEFGKRVVFPADVVRLRGTQTLRAVPQIVVGTIHSVKGGQADVVYLFPHLSSAGDTQYQQSGKPRDSVVRV